MVSPTFKCLNYVLIAALTALAAELSTIEDLSNISSTKIAVIATQILLQSLIAVRAFFDQTLSKNKENLTDV